MTIATSLGSDPRTMGAFARTASPLTGVGRSARRILMVTKRDEEVLWLGETTSQRTGRTILSAISASHLILGGDYWMDVAQCVPLLDLRWSTDDEGRLCVAWRSMGISVGIRISAGAVEAEQIIAQRVESLTVLTHQASAPARAAMPLPDLHLMTWQEAEDLAVRHMVKIGYGDATRSPAGADGGIDVASRRAVAQVKHYGVRVTPRPVRELRGVAGKKTALFYALNGYTRQAVEDAERLDVALFTYDGFGAVTPINSPAKALAPGSPILVQRLDRSRRAEKAIAERALRLEFKAQALLRVRGIHERRRRKVQARIGSAQAAISDARSRSALAPWRRQMHLDRGERDLKEAARIAGVSYRKL